MGLFDSRVSVLAVSLAVVAGTGCGDKAGGGAGTDGATDGATDGTDGMTSTSGGTSASGSGSGTTGVGGQCVTDLDCPGRGQVCDVGTYTCVPDPYDPSTTESPAPADFVGKVIPFHRGQVCLPTEVRAGASFPVSVTPCLHPCLTVQSFKFKQWFECVGSVCNSYVVVWYVVDGAACPADAFSEFDPGMCQGEPPIELTVNTTLDTGPIVGTMSVEVPFLTNADMAGVAPTGTENPSIDQLKALIFQYPLDPARLANDGEPILLEDNFPIPPVTCDGGGCPCFDVGL